ncbi:hypothetical protein THAOC_08513, partial [Thalassiosira oceanica]
RVEEVADWSARALIGGYPCHTRGLPPREQAAGCHFRGVEQLVRPRIARNAQFGARYCDGDNDAEDPQDDAELAPVAELFRAHLLLAQAVRAAMVVEQSSAAAHLHQSQDPEQHPVLQPLRSIPQLPGNVKAKGRPHITDQKGHPAAEPDPGEIVQIAIRNRARGVRGEPVSRIAHDRGDRAPQREEGEDQEALYLRADDDARDDRLGVQHHDCHRQQKRHGAGRDCISLVGLGRGRISLRVRLLERGRGRGKSARFPLYARATSRPRGRRRAVRTARSGAWMEGGPGGAEARGLESDQIKSNQSNEVQMQRVQRVTLLVSSWLGRRADATRKEQTLGDSSTFDAVARRKGARAILRCPDSRRGWLWTVENDAVGADSIRLQYLLSQCNIGRGETGRPTGGNRGRSRWQPRLASSRRKQLDRVQKWHRNNQPDADRNPRNNGANLQAITRADEKVRKPREERRGQGRGTRAKRRAYLSVLHPSDRGSRHTSLFQKSDPLLLRELLGKHQASWTPRLPVELLSLLV